MRMLRYDEGFASYCWCATYLHAQISKFYVAGVGTTRWVRATLRWIKFTKTGLSCCVWGWWYGLKATELTTRPHFCSPDCSRLSCWGRQGDNQSHSTFLEQFATTQVANLIPQRAGEDGQIVPDIVPVQVFGVVQTKVQWIHLSSFIPKRVWILFRIG